MYHITKIGENARHDNNFLINRPHGHKVYLLLLIKTPSKFFIDNKWEEIPADSAVIFAPGQTHLYGASTEDYVNCWLHFTLDQEFPNSHFPLGKPIPMTDKEDFYQLFHLICREFYGSSDYKIQTLHNLTSALVTKIVSIADQKKHPSIYYELRNLREEIYRFPSMEWSISLMAKKLNISTGYLQNSYPKYFKTTCINDVITSRIQYSCELLAIADLSVAEIAIKRGYHNPEHFIRQFKSKMNMTPSQYRKKE